MTLAFDGLPRLPEVIRHHGIAARKSLGQNFLLDLQLTGKIARAAGPFNDTTVVEIGPGPGGLTRALLAEGAAKVIAIERDDRCLAALAEISAHYPGRLEVVAGDALSTDLKAVAPSGAKIVANLPYNIATPLLVGWLDDEPWPSWWSSLTLMFQKEVADRIVAKPGSRAYGRLGVLAGWRTYAFKLFDVPASTFTPPPKVTSSIVQLESKADAEDISVSAMQAVTAAAFGQRRKMLRSSLRSIARSYAGGVDALLADAELPPTARAETIPIDGFLRVARLIS